MNRMSIGADPKFKELLREVKIDRIKKGKDTFLLSDRRLTLAIARISNIKDVLTEAKIEEELRRRGK